jgi:hypothetical protein
MSNAQHEVLQMRMRLLLIIALLTAGCSGPVTVASPAATTTPVPPTVLPATEVPTSTPTATVTPTTAPTATPLPTTAPTATPTPVPTPTRLPAVTRGQEVAFTQAARGALPGLVDLPGYEIEATVDMETLTVAGQQRVTYTHRRDEPTSEVYLNLYANAPRFGGEMDASNVRVNGRPVQAAYERERRALRVPFPAPLARGEQASIELDFSLRVPALEANEYQLLVYSNEILSLAGWYPMLAVLDDDVGWHLDYPEELIGEAMHAESAFYTVQITVPQSLVVAATGVQVDETVDEDTRTLTYRSGPSRTFYVSASPNYAVVSGQTGETTVHSYYVEGHEACGQWVLEVSIAALELFEGLYGPYPYAEFDAVEADQWYNGMEWPGMLSLGASFYGGEDPVCGEWFAAHEVSHQWWYNVVGNDPVAHPWLDEALAHYSTMLYYRRLWEPESAEVYIQAVVYDRYDLYKDRPGGVDLSQGTADFDDRKEYYGIIYVRGAMFVEALHELLGEEAFFDVLQRYYRENQFQIATPETLYDILSEYDPDGVNKLWQEYGVTTVWPGFGGQN